MDQAIQNNKKGMVIAKEAIALPLEEKSVEGESLVYTSSQEEKDAPLEEVSIEEEEGEEVVKMVEEFFVDGNEALAILLVHIPVGERQHQIRF